jgi:pilus assembly protein Flp/PilA
MKFINKLLRDDNGATAIEYGLIAALISLAGISAFNGMGSAVKAQYGASSTLYAAQTATAA